MASAPGIAGRVVTIKRGAVPTLVAGVRTKGITVNGTPIDVTTDDSAGWRALLDLSGQNDVSLTVAGVVVGAGLRVESLTMADRVQPTDFEIPGTAALGGGKYSGEFFLASYAETGEYNGAMTFTAEFQSAGPVTYTPGT